MATNRAFFPQDAVDRWLAQGSVSLEGEVLVLLPDGPAFLLESAVRFVAEVAAGHDGPGLCGKVKTLPAIEALHGEYDLGSVVLGDFAYEVVDGFVGELLEMAPDGWGVAPQVQPSHKGSRSPRSTQSGNALRKPSSNSSQSLRAVQSAKSGFSIPAVSGARAPTPGSLRARPSRPATPPRASSVSIAVTGHSVAPPALGADEPPPPPLSGARSALVALSELVSQRMNP